jgi:opacity protein-like surface antigen
MRKLLVWCLLLPLAGYSQQRVHLTILGGFSNYQGDLQTKNLTLNQANLAVGAGLQYDFTPHIAARLGFNYGSLEADDKQNSGLLRARNLNFHTKIVEGSLLLQYTLFDLSDKRLSPYVFAGAAIYHFDPYTYDTLGNKIFLKPLSTEGQGLSQYPNRKEYKLTQFAIPFGGGIKFRVSDNVTLGYEFGIRKLFTDYIDDVSTTYVDPLVLASQRGLKAVEMSYRGGELKGGNPNYPAINTKRGGKADDWYYITGLTLTIGLGGNGDKDSYSGWNGRRSRLGCPKVRE